MTILVDLSETWGTPQQAAFGHRFPQARVGAVLLPSARWALVDDHMALFPRGAYLTRSFSNMTSSSVFLLQH